MSMRSAQSIRIRLGRVITEWGGKRTLLNAEKIGSSHVGIVQNIGIVLKVVADNLA